MTIRLGVGIPAYGARVASAQAKMWMQFGAQLARIRERLQYIKLPIELVMIADVDVCGVDRARNILLGTAHEHRCDWLLMIDSDTWVHDSSALVRMILDADSIGAAAVGAPVKTRGGDGLNVYRWDAEQMRHLPALTLDGYLEPIKVDAIGAAVFAVNMRKVGRARFQWLYRADGSSMSEDLYFCQQLREAGEKILVDPRVHTSHVDRPSVLST